MKCLPSSEFPLPPLPTCSSSHKVGIIRQWRIEFKDSGKFYQKSCTHEGSAPLVTCDVPVHGHKYFLREALGFSGKIILWFMEIWKSQGALIVLLSFLF